MAKKKKVFSGEKYIKIMTDCGLNPYMWTWWQHLEGKTEKQCGYLLDDSWMVEVEYGKKKNDKPTDM